MNLLLKVPLQFCDSIPQVINLALKSHLSNSILNCSINYIGGQKIVFMQIHVYLLRYFNVAHDRLILISTPRPA